MDITANMLTIIRNGQASKKESVIAPYSKINFGILEILKKNGKIAGMEIKKSTGKEWLVVYLKYDESGKASIETIKKISKPGKRIYRKKADFFPVRQGYGFYIVSTPLGLMIDKEAKAKGVGGEVLCEIW